MLSLFPRNTLKIKEEIGNSTIPIVFDLSFQDAFRLEPRLSEYSQTSLWLSGAASCSNNGDTTLALITIAPVFSIRPLRPIARPLLISMGFQILAIIIQKPAALRFALA